MEQNKIRFSEILLFENINVNLFTKFFIIEEKENFKLRSDHFLLNGSFRSELSIS